MTQTGTSPTSSSSLYVKRTDTDGEEYNNSGDAAKDGDDFKGG